MLDLMPSGSSISPMRRSCVSCVRRRSVFSLFLAICLILWSNPAPAERNLQQAQRTQWVELQFATLGAMTLANIAAFSFGEPASVARIETAPVFERGAELNKSALTRHLSDAAFITSLTTPLATLGVAGNPAWGQALLIYAETLELSLLANTLTKRLVRRARPYTHGEGGAALAKNAGLDAYYSFYSGHTALTFSAATSSSILFSSISESQRASAVQWSASLALAAFTAHARIRGGMHYPTDVLVGALAGIGFGLALPAIHHVSLTITPLEIACAAGGTLTGFLLGYLLPQGRAEISPPVTPQIVPTPGGATLSLAGPWR